MNQAAASTWWDRNREWALPGGIVLCVALTIGAFVLMTSFIMGVMKSSDVYVQALAKALANSSITRALGTPIKEGLFVSGNIKVSNQSGSADLAIPVSGPLGKATIFVIAKRSAGEWTYSRLVVEIEKSNERINLLE